MAALVLPLEPLGKSDMLLLDTLADIVHDGGDAFPLVDEHIVRRGRVGLLVAALACPGVVESMSDGETLYNHAMLAPAGNHLTVWRVLWHFRVPCNARGALEEMSEFFDDEETAFMHAVAAEEASPSTGPTSRRTPSVPSGVANAGSDRCRW